MVVDLSSGEARILDENQAKSSEESERKSILPWKEPAIEGLPKFLEDGSPYGKTDYLSLVDYQLTASAQINDFSVMHASDNGHPVNRTQLDQTMTPKPSVYDWKTCLPSSSSVVIDKSKSKSQPSQLNLGKSNSAINDRSHSHSSMNNQVSQISSESKTEGFFFKTPLGEVDGPQSTDAKMLKVNQRNPTEKRYSDNTPSEFVHTMVSTVSAIPDKYLNPDEHSLQRIQP